jgi:prefoldin subunit 5
MSEVELLTELLNEVRLIRENLDELKVMIGDINQRIANIETSRLIPESVRRL